jgi:His/Glu/Gln/Arg/opine family amino acid ABC transporter permease subunit
MLAVSEFRTVRWLARGWIELFRSIPILALMIFLYFGLGPYVAKIGLGPFTIAVTALSVSSSAYLAEIYRGAIRSVPRAQWNAATSLGMGHRLALRQIIIPQVIPPLVPSTLNALISVVKFSSLASLITVNELTLASTLAVSLSFYPMTVYLLLGVCYAVMIIPLIYFLRWVEHWTKRRYGLVAAQVRPPATDPYALVGDVAGQTGKAA